METEDSISIEIFSRHFGVEMAFVSALSDYGLIEIVQIRQQSYIPAAQLESAEKMTRLYLDLDINTEGIDVIMNLLSRMKAMQEQITVLQNRLGLYE